MFLHKNSLIYYTNMWQLDIKSLVRHISFPQSMDISVSEINVSNFSRVCRCCDDVRSESRVTLTGGRVELFLEAVREAELSQKALVEHAVSTGLCFWYVGQSMTRRLSDVQEANCESKALYIFLESFGQNISLLTAGLLIRSTCVDWQQRPALLV